MVKSRETVLNTSSGQALGLPSATKKQVVDRYAFRSGDQNQLNPVTDSKDSKDSKISDDHDIHDGSFMQPKNHRVSLDSKMTGSFSKTAMEAAFNRIDTIDHNATLNSNRKSLGMVNNGNGQKVQN